MTFPYPPSPHIGPYPPADPDDQPDLVIGFDRPVALHVVAAILGSFGPRWPHARVANGRTPFSGGWTGPAFNVYLGEEVDPDDGDDPDDGL